MYLLKRSWRCPYGPRLCNINDFYHYAVHPLKKFYTSLSGALQKCFKSGPALANAGPAHHNKASYWNDECSFLIHCH